MIGYIKIYKPDLKIKEYQVYGSYYCGICKSLGDNYGLPLRNLLNYDSVFIALLRDSFLSMESGYGQFRCILHPTKKKTRCTDNASVDFAADLTIFMTYWKLADNARDEGGVFSRIGAAAMKKSYEKSKERLGGLSSAIEKELERLAVLESADCDDLDTVSDCYGNIMSEILSYAASGNESALKQASWMGYNLGKWIYVLDAYDDLQRDMENNSYNPFAYGQKEYDGSPGEYKRKISDRVGFTLFYALDEAARAYELIDNTVNSGIIKNILYEGLYNVTRKILDGETIDGSEESI
ncbi:MAG: hypothetical protein JXB33_07165 [Clostridia bacterium]|nr:hypothetical protein [Clostridia bacterium]